jgi:regulator of protease activity HflC (stomatin/prohibitin superfamily)
MRPRDIIIKDTHRGLWYEDGVLVKVLEAGRHVIPRQIDLGFWRTPRVEVALVDLRERDLTIKGQEILTADKVAIRISIVVQYRVVDPRAALHAVANYEERLYTDVQLAARRSLASMTLDEILTDRNRLSEDIQRDVYKVAGTYGVAIVRADVKDLTFPGNLQEIMNKVLAAERTSQAQLVEARTRAELQRIDAETKGETMRLLAESQAKAERLAAESKGQSLRLQAEAEAQTVQLREQTAIAFEKHPALLRLRELEALRELAQSSGARIYVDFDRRAKQDAARSEES